MDRNGIVKFLDSAQKLMAENKEHLIELDSIFGDGDLGLTMKDGFKAAYDSANESDEPDLGKLLYSSGKTMASSAPSSMGTLMASGFMNAGKELKGKTELSNDEVHALFSAYEQGVINRGKAKIGEKTFLDGFHPGVEALKKELDNGADLKNSALSAAAAARAGFEDSKQLVARHGRAAIRGEASISQPDPGAYVGVLIMDAFADSLN